jgi:hypothetical protein
MLENRMLTKICDPNRQEVKGGCIVEEDIGRACSKHGRELHTGFCFHDMKEREHM